MFVRNSCALLLLLLLSCCNSVRNFTIFERLRRCTGKESVLTCLKEEAIDAINATIYNDRPLNIYGVDVIRDVNYVSNDMEGNASENASQRSVYLNDMLADKVKEFVKSRVVRLPLSNVFEGRKKGGGGGGKKGSMMVMGAVAMAGLTTVMFLGKIGFMASIALLVAKMALMLSLILGFRKMADGHGESAHVVYASESSGHGYGHGGHGGHGGYGGWHRSVSHEDDPQNIAYKGYMPLPEENINY